MNFKESFKINPKKLRDLIIAELLFYILIISYPALLTKIFSSIFQNLGEAIQGLNSTENIQQLLLAQTQIQSMFWSLILFVVLIIIGLIIISAFTSYLAYMTQHNKKICCEKKYWKFLLNHSIWIVFSGLIIALLFGLSYVWNSIWVSTIGLLIFIYLGYIKIFFMSSTIISSKLKTPFKNLKYMFTIKSCKRTGIAFLVFIIFGMIMNLTLFINIVWLNQIIFYLMLSIYIIWARNYLGETFKEEIKKSLEKKQQQKKPTKKKIIKKKTPKKKSTKTKKVAKKKSVKKKIIKK